jgi:hypothetical protein
MLVVVVQRVALARQALELVELVEAALELSMVLEIMEWQTLAVAVAVARPLAVMAVLELSLLDTQRFRR